jgi:ABC-type bacteriocin/lantibiotic exporter with double-glycine peptidase domain
MVKAFVYLFFTLYMLYQRVGVSGFLTFVFIGIKVGQDHYFRKTREKAWKKVGKASDARTNEISEAFKNIKTLKLYNWTETFTNRIKKKRTKQEDLTWTAETKNMANHGGHKLMNSLMKPTIIMSGYYFGY